MESLQCIDFNIFAEIITDMYKKMLFLNAFSVGLRKWSGTA